MNKGAYLEEDLSTEQHKKKKDLRFFDQDEHKGWKKRHQQKEGQRKKEVGCLVVIGFAFSLHSLLPFLFNKLLLMKKYSLGKEEKLLKPFEFKSTLSRGTGRSTEHFKILICPNNLMKRRLGITTSKKMGSATKRNRARRLLREFFRLNKMCLPPSSDIVFIAKPGADTLDYSGVRDELKIIFFTRTPLV